MPVVRRVLASAVAVLALVSCGGSADDDDEATGRQHRGHHHHDRRRRRHRPAEPADPRSSCSNPAPSRAVELRYTLVAGATQRFSTSTVLDQSVDDVSPGTITTIVEILTEVVSASPEEATFTATYGAPVVETEAGTPQEVADAVADGAGVLAGAVARISIDPRGDVLDLDLQLDEDASDLSGRALRHGVRQPLREPGPAERGAARPSRWASARSGASTSRWRPRA